MKQKYSNNQTVWVDLEARRRRRMIGTIIRHGPVPGVYRVKINDTTIRDLPEACLIPREQQ